jgi:predicted ABC-class ATPase
MYLISHFRSTILRALAVGFYDKIPGDGREFVVTVPSSATIRSEDGRYVRGVDISPFIDNLPPAAGIDPTRFWYAEKNELACSTIQNFHPFPIYFNLLAADLLY